MILVQIKRKLCKECLNPIPDKKRKDAKFCSVSCREKSRSRREKPKRNRYQREYYKKKKTDHLWHQAHKSKRKKSYYKNRERELKSATEWWTKNKSRSLEVRRLSYPKKTRERELLKFEVFSIYSKRDSNSNIPCCACCGEKSHIEFLALDHVSGKRSWSKKTGKGRTDTGHKLRLWAKKNDYPNTLQVLCHNCNTAKGQNGVCPHKK